MKPNLEPLSTKLKRLQEAESDAAFNGDTERAQMLYNQLITVEKRIQSGEVWDVNF